MKRIVCFFVAVILVSFASVAQAQEPTDVTAQMINKRGEQVGQATFTADASGAVRVQVTLNPSDIPPGSHGIHFHQFGQCNLPDFLGAGEHFNPSNTKHGLQNPQGPHAGDLPTMQIAADGSGTYDTTTAFVTLGQGNSSLLDADGSALVIHSGTDDQVTDPSGNSGDRLVCGVLVAAQAATSNATPNATAVPSQQTTPGTLPTTGGESLPIPVLPILGGLLLLAGLWLRWKAFPN